MKFQTILNTTLLLVIALACIAIHQLRKQIANLNTLAIHIQIMGVNPLIEFALEVDGARLARIYNEQQVGGKSNWQFKPNTNANIGAAP